MARPTISALWNSSAVVSMSQAKLPAARILAASSCSWPAIFDQAHGAAASCAAAAQRPAPPIFFSRLPNLQPAVKLQQALVAARREGRQLQSMSTGRGCWSKSSSWRQGSNKCRWLLIFS